MAKKMALVPLDLVSHTEDAPLLNQLASLDNEMKSILLENTGNDLKLRKYQDALRKYQQLTESRTAKKDPPPQPPPVTEPEVREAALPREQIIRNMPAQKQRSAKILLDFMGTIPELEVSNQNEIIINGNTVRHSNIHDLVSDLTRDKKGAPPRGHPELARLLKAHNVPLEAIGSQHRKNTFRYHDEEFRSLPATRRSSSYHLPSLGGRPLSIEDFPTHSRFNVLQQQEEEEEEEEVPKKRRKSKRISSQGPRVNFSRVFNQPDEKPSMRDVIKWKYV